MTIKVLDNLNNLNPELQLLLNKNREYHSLPWIKKIGYKFGLVKLKADDKHPGFCQKEEALRLVRSK